MSLNKINLALSIIVIVTLASFLLTTWSDIEESSFRYGKDFNWVRDSLGISSIEKDWITTENSKWRRQWGHPGRSVNTIHQST